MNEDSIRALPDELELEEPEPQQHCLKFLNPWLTSSTRKWKTVLNQCPHGHPSMDLQTRGLAGLSSQVSRAAGGKRQRHRRHVCF